MAQNQIGVGWHKKTPNDLDEYVKEKIKMLEEEFYIRLTLDDITHFRSLKNKRDVDAFAHQIFEDRL